MSGKCPLIPFAYLTNIDHFPYLFFDHFPFLRFYLILEGKGGRKKREISIASLKAPAGELACKPGICPDLKSNWWAFGLQDRAQSTEPHQPGPFSFPFLFFSFFFKEILFIFRQRGREGEGKGEKHQCVAASHPPSTRDLACNPGMFPDWELNQWPLGSQAIAQSTEPHQPGPFSFSLTTRTVNRQRYTFEFYSILNTWLASLLNGLFSILVKYILTFSKKFMLCTM